MSEGAMCGPPNRAAHRSRIAAVFKAPPTSAPWLPVNEHMLMTVRTARTAEAVTATNPASQATLGLGEPGVREGAGRGRRISDGLLAQPPGRGDGARTKWPLAGGPDVSCKAGCAALAPGGACVMAIGPRQDNDRSTPVQAGTGCAPTRSTRRSRFSCLFWLVNLDEPRWMHGAASRRRVRRRARR